MNWIEVTATFEVEPEDWSPFVDIFVRHGCENTIQTDSPPTLGAAVVDVTGANEVVDALTQDLEAAGARVVSRPLVEENWDELWRKFFKPRRIGERFVIRPTWEEFAARPDDHVIVLDPGQAFGTGDHPTTRMCLELLERADLNGKNVADVGCGSGILSVAAKMRGAKRVQGIDIEALSVEVARENSTINKVDCEFVVGDSIFALDGAPFDVVVSNIISATLIAMANDFADNLVAKGTWIASGIIDQNWPDVQAAAARAGFEWVEERREDGWVGAQFVRSS